MPKFYLTTAIDYSNGAPHLGHAFEKIGADCLARYRRLIGDDVHFVIGMDEHGQNVAQSAERAGVEPQAWVDGIARQFHDAWRVLHISHDDFIRTTEPRHARGVLELLRRIQEAGYVYRGRYAGFYCVGCESFKLEKDLADGRCPQHPSLEIKWLEEENHFFKLSAFRDRLLRHYDAHPDFVRPESKMREVRNVVEGGLQDLSISRARLTWGIPFPGSDVHTVYVWFDALINYLSATGFPDAGFERLWPADIHVIGPDITRFHAVIWPAMLLAASLPVPRRVWAHGWVNTQGSRFSKTEGVRVTLDEAIARHGPDALRYFLLREVPWDGDGDFSWERFDARYNSELADTFGNLVSRTLTMVHRYRGGRIPAARDNRLEQQSAALLTRYREAMDACLLHLGADAFVALASEANRFIEETAPWKLAKAGKDDELDLVLATLVRVVARLTVMLGPFAPAKAAGSWQALGDRRKLELVRWTHLDDPLQAGSTVSAPPIVFPKPPSKVATA